MKELITIILFLLPFAASGEEIRQTRSEGIQQGAIVDTGGLASLDGHRFLRRDWGADGWGQWEEWDLRGCRTALVTEHAEHCFNGTGLGVTSGTPGESQIVSDVRRLDLPDGAWPTGYEQAVSRGRVDGSAWIGGQLLSKTQWEARRMKEDSPESRFPILSGINKKREQINEWQLNNIRARGRALRATPPPPVIVSPVPPQSYQQQQAWNANFDARLTRVEQQLAEIVRLLKPATRDEFEQ